MSSENILIIKNSGILFVRLLCTSAIGLFTSRFVIQSLGPSDFGLYTVVGGLVVMMGFLNVVMISTTYRFIAFEMGKGTLEGVNKVFNISLIIHLFLALFTIVLTETVGIYYIYKYLNVDAGKIKDAIFVLRFSTYAAVFTIVSVPYQGLITALEKFSAQATIEIIRSLMVFGSALTIWFYIGNRIKLYAFLVAVVNTMIFLLFFMYCRRKYRETIKWHFQRDTSKYKEMLAFSSWIMMGAAASVGQTSGAALIVNGFFGTIVNAAFGIANQVNSIISVLSKNLGQAAVPQITKSFSSGNRERTINLAAYISKYTYFLMLLPALPLLLETDFLLTLWLGELPPHTVTLSQLMIINALVGSLGAGLPAVIQATGKIKYFQIILSTTSLLSLPFAYLLFVAEFPPSAILVTFISAGIVNVAVWQFLLKLIIDFDVYFFLKTSYLKIFYVSIVIMPLFYIHDVFPEGGLRFVSFSLLSVGWLSTAIYFLGMEGKERKITGQLLLKMIR